MRARSKRNEDPRKSVIMNCFWFAPSNRFVCNVSPSPNARKTRRSRRDKLFLSDSGAAARRPGEGYARREIVLWQY